MSGILYPPKNPKSNRKGSRCVRVSRFTWMECDPIIVYTDVVLASPGVMDDDKASKGRPLKAPRKDLDPPAADTPDPGCGDSAPPEVSKPKEKAAARTSNNEEGLCAHLERFEDDMVMFVSKLMSSKFTPSCQRLMCVNKVEKSSILVCIDCSLPFCIGDGTMNKPQGHARAHAQFYSHLEKHCVAALFSKPETLYCFICERRLNLEITEMEAESDSSSDEVGCEHFVLDEEEITLIVSEITASKNVPVCQHPGCTITGNTRIMVCTGCNKHFCTRAEAKKKPHGHARLHARKCEHHWVGLWYSDPYMGYCFKCEFEWILGAPNVERGMVFGKEAFGQESGLVKGNGCVIRGMPNLGNTCYMNALLQCLFVLEKLRASMLASDAPSGFVGGALKELFQEVNSVNNAQRPLNPTKFLARNQLDKEEKSMIPAVSTTVVDSIFRVQLSATISCRRCSYNSVSHEVMYDLSVPLPSESLPPKSIASPPRNISCMSQEKIGIKLFPKVDMSNTEIVQAIAEGRDSHITGLELGNVDKEKTSEPLEVDSVEVEQHSQSKDGVHVPSQIQKDEVPGEIIWRSPSKADDLGKNDNAGLENTSGEPEVSIEAKKNVCSVERAAEDKGKAQFSNMAYGKAKDNNSLASIEECLALHFEAELVEWRCENCSEIARRMSTTSGKDGEQMMASTNENTIIDGDQTEQSDKIARQSEQSSNLDSGEQDLASDNTANKINECHEGVQEAVPSCLPAEELDNQLSGQGQNASSLDQVKLDHSADQVDPNQKEREDRNQGGIQTRFINKLPPVFAIHLKRSKLTGKVRGHVSFEEILDVGQFMDPSSEDKDNSSYHLVGVIEHIGPSTSSGHMVAYVRPNQEQPDGGPSPWYCASDTNIRQAHHHQPAQRHVTVPQPALPPNSSSASSSSQDAAACAPADSVPLLAFSGVMDEEKASKGRPLKAPRLDLDLNLFAAAVPDPGCGDTASPEEKASKGRPLKAPRLDLDLNLLAAAVPDPGCGDPALLEASKPEEKAATPTSNTDEELCAHFVRFEEDMVRFISKLRSSKSAARCQHYLCENKVDKSSILVCIDCSLPFCIGDGTMDKPQGHARWHADLEQHCVAALFSKPETLYCFICERCLNMEVDDMELESDSAGCRHLLDEEDITLIVSEVTASKSIPACQHPGCKINGITRIMVCTGCNKHFCTRAEAKKKPHGHARLHARKCEHHWVGLWYSDPYKGYCFKCEFDLTLSTPTVEQGMVFGKELFGQESGLAKGHGYVIRGMPNLGNTCYINALLQCLFVLGKLRARMLAPDAPSYILGNELKELFQEEEKSMVPPVSPTVVDSIFRVQLSATISCRHCSYNSVSHEVMYELSVPLPSERPPPKSTASPPRDISCMSREKTGIKLFPEVDMSNTKIVQAIAEGSDSHITSLELGDVDKEKTSEPLDVDSVEVEQRSQSKDGVHVSSQIEKDEVPGEIIWRLPSKTDDLGQNDNAGLENMFGEPEVSIEAKKNSCSVEGAVEDKGKAQFSNMAYGKAKDNDSLASIEECLALFFKEELLEWRCENCSGVAHRLSTTSSKDGEQMMASTNENTVTVRDQTEQLDKVARQSEQSNNLDSLALGCTSSKQPHGSDSQCKAMLAMESITEGISTLPLVEHKYALRSRGPPPSHNRITSGMIHGEQDLASDNIANKKTDCREGVQEAASSCLPAEEPADLLSGQGENTSSLDQGKWKQVKLDHSADQVDANQKEREDRNQGGIQTRVINKLPPVLVIHLKRSKETGKVRGHVSFEEILDVGQFMDPSSEDKGNSSYLLVGVIEHIGPSTSSGHMVAYVRPNQEQPDGGTSPWYCASDTNIGQVSLEEVLKCEASLFFYERIGG
uniref:Ubiquitinyl hydrolase 1 n=1 Tax=Oryza punctata TaxID=4537 RepID=A0A0E0LX51_ORYPU